MMARKCPQCTTTIPAGHALAYSNALECPGCKKSLTVADGSRYLATLAGLLAAVLVWRLWGNTDGLLGWVKPVLVGLFAYSIVAPLALAFLADLRMKPGEPVYEAAHSSGGPGGHH
jgi:hypothetical protein